MELMRVMIGKVEDKHRLESVLGRVITIRAGTLGWNCVGWVQEALQELERDRKALGTSVIAWQSVYGNVVLRAQDERGPLQG